MFELAVGGEVVVACAAVFVIHESNIRGVPGGFVVLGPATAPADDDIVAKEIRGEAVVKHALHALALRHRRAILVHAAARRSDRLGARGKDTICDGETGHSGVDERTADDEQTLGEKQ